MMDSKVVISLFNETESEIYMEQLLALPWEFREYKRYNKPVKVPRGQIAYQCEDDSLYNYKAAGGSPTV